MSTFSDLGLAEPILRAVTAEGYTTPTPIQSKAIPPLLAGRDVIGVAQTGTGKTASFVLPLLHRLETQKRKRSPKTCRVLILSPTRELAAQIMANIKNYSKYTKISATLIVGGARMNKQIHSLKGGIEIVVATPGRLLDHMRNGAVDLSQTQMTVIDEADQMLDMGFLPDIRKIVGDLPENRQMALLSATMPAQIRKLTNDLLRSPTKISIEAQSRPVERIAQSVRHVAKLTKRDELTKILQEKDVERTVVFTRTKRGADRVCKHLKATGLRTEAIHGDKTQGQRNRAMAAFRNGKSDILIATDIAARGIDIDDITHVINFELPNVPEAYIHRIGRTARAGRSGVAISLCDPSERKLLKDIERLIGMRVQSDDPLTPQKTELLAHSLDDEPKKRRRRKPRRKPETRGASQNSKPGARKSTRFGKNPAKKRKPSGGAKRSFAKAGGASKETTAA